MTNYPADENVATIDGSTAVFCLLLADIASKPLAKTDALLQVKTVVPYTAAKVLLYLTAMQRQ